MEPSDGELVLSARVGAAEAFAGLTRHRAAMYAVAVSVLGPGPDVEDVVQDACLVALAGLHQVREPERVRSWLMGICRNLAHQILRRTSASAADLATHDADHARLERERLTLFAGIVDECNRGTDRGPHRAVRAGSSGPGARPKARADADAAAEQSSGPRGRIRGETSPAAT